MLGTDRGSAAGHRSRASAAGSGARKREDLLRPSADSEPRPASTLPRALVAADGTLVSILEAYACEPIRVVKLSQALGAVASGSPSPDLPVEPGENVLRRSVLLQGVRTGVNFVCAEGIIRTDRLPLGVVAELVSSGTPLRRILADNRIGSFRELVRADTEAAGAYARHFEMPPTDTLMRRTYRLLIDKQPVILISEIFPLGRLA